MTRFPFITHLTTQPARARLMRFGVPAWAVLISVLTLADLVVPDSPSDKGPDDAPRPSQASQPGLPLLQARIAELSQQIEERNRQPPPLPRARFDAAQKTLETRLASIEQTLGAALTQADADALRERLEKIEIRLDSTPVQNKPPMRRPPAAAAKPGPVPLPFTVIGLERRADEPFLSIVPAGAAPVPPFDILHQGETLSGWRLDAIEGRTAILSNGAARRHVAVP